MTDENTVQATGTDPEERAVYEIAFHVVPVLDEEARAGVVEALRNSVESRGGTVLGEHNPQLLDLAYPMDRQIQGKRQTFHTAYFGWLFADLEKAKLEEVNQELMHLESIIRFLVVKTTKEIALEPTSFSFSKRGTHSIVEEAEEEKSEPEDKGEVIEEELDEAIDNLVGDEDTENVKTQPKDEDAVGAEVDEAVEKAAQ